ncbi:DUF6861 domain-containing protein [Rhodanobacter ginsengiterrae]|uniref:DUF6861 domain-containing protein n=1 Tax=Rhodanobacter ginsengiterrae TaxID=2008451 RepID=UPI003CEB4754
MTLATSIQGSWSQFEHWAGRQVSSVRGQARLISARADCLQLALKLSEGLAVYRILRDFQHLDLNEVVNDIVEVLRQCLIVMLTTTGGGALIGGVAGGVFGVGVGAVPGIAIGAAAGAQMGEWILIFMGLKALSEYIVRDMPDIARAYWDGIRLAWSAATAPPLPQQPVRIDAFAIRHAAEKIARAHVAMFVLLLMGIVAYLAKGRGDMGQLAEGVRSSRMGPKFAEWMVRNEGKLKAEPRLQPKAANALEDPPPPAKPRTNPTQRPRPPAASKPTPVTADKPAFRGTIKYRSAKDANTELFDRGFADPAHPPFKAGTQVTDRIMSPGEKVNMLVDSKQLGQLQNLKSPFGLGGWGSPDSFSTQSQGLERMGITSGPGGFKPNGIQYQIELQAVKPLRVLEGTAGPQGVLAGGGQQTYLDVAPSVRRSVLKLVKVTPLPRP